MLEFAPYLRGFITGMSLIIAIGAQNAYVLMRSILRNHHWVVALLCSVIDLSLIVAGLTGMGQLVNRYPALLNVTAVGGILFLFGYGARAFRRCWQADALEPGGRPMGLAAAVAGACAISLLNPHVYLDTVILLGSIGVQEVPADRLWFGLGAVSASFIWFFLLALGGQYLGPWFRNPRAWKVLDGLIGTMMWGIAITLIMRLAAGR